MQGSELNPGCVPVLSKRAPNHEIVHLCFSVSCNLLFCSQPNRMPLHSTFSHVIVLYLETCAAYHTLFFHQHETCLLQYDCPSPNRITLRSVPGTYRSDPATHLWCPLVYPNEVEVSLDTYNAVISTIRLDQLLLLLLMLLYDWY
jgi:hypothetical protein